MIENCETRRIQVEEENPISISETVNFHHRISSLDGNKGISSLSLSGKKLKPMSFTPEPNKICKFEDKFDICPFESIVMQNENNETNFGGISLKNLSQNQEIKKLRASSGFKSDLAKECRDMENTEERSNSTKADTLNTKMSNFLKNYDDLICLFSSPSNNNSPSINKKDHKEEIDSLVTICDRRKSIIVDFINPSCELETSKNPSSSSNEFQLTLSAQSSVSTLTNTEDIKDFYEYTEECLKRITKIQVPDITQIQCINLPKELESQLQNGKRLAIFDLDETLVHAEIKDYKNAFNQIPCKLPNGGYQTIGLNIRPYWKESLREIAKNYVIIVYTASHQSYADSVLDYIDPENEIIKHRLYRHNCTKVKMEEEQIYVKDLRIFNNVRMEDMIIIDNSVLSFAFQLDNGIPILPYYNSCEDNELKSLANYLTSICKVQDLRSENKASIKLDYFLQKVLEEEEEQSEVSYETEEEGEGENNFFSLFKCEEQDKDTSFFLPNFAENDSEPVTPNNNKKLRTQKIRKQTFKDQLLHTLEDLKNNFSNFSKINIEKKRSSQLYVAID
jgi:Dullard-like phosphatase family protein